MKEFKLYSHGENWFHFRMYPDSTMESFTVTYCHDGTVCMTGDYGCLLWRREYFPKRPDYGFPNKDTWIGYFAEKVVRAEDEQKIRVWYKEIAIDQIKEHLAEFQKEEYNKGVVVLTKVLEELDWVEDGDYGRIQMLEAFNDHNDCLESETYYDFGMDYTEAFKAKFDKLVAISSLILDIVNKDAQVSAQNVEVVP